MKISLLCFLAALTCVPHEKYQVEKRDLQDQGPHYLIKISYPMIPADDAFNKASEEAMDLLKDAFKGALVEPDSKVDTAVGNYLQGGYEAQVLKEGVVSVLFDYDEYTSGAAHPWDVMTTVNYDARNCRVLRLADLFQPGTDYVGRISQLAIAYLEEDQYADNGAIEHGAGPVESNFKYFTLTNDSLVLHFPMAQVAPTAAGAQTAVIPFTKLASILRRDALGSAGTQ